MNKNVLIGLILAVLIIGGVVMVKNSSKNTAPVTTTTNTTQTQNPITAPSSAVKESPTKEPEAMSQKEDTVTLIATGFTPATITVKKGDKVVWVNKSGDVATVNSDPHPTHTNYQPLNLNSFNDGEKLELVFDKAGTYGYHDHLHPSRRGTVVVE